MAFKLIILCALLLSFSSWFTTTGVAQGGGAGGFSCVQKLLPCQPYLKDPKPPATCCVPLKETLADDKTCLCTVFYNQEILKQFNVTQDEALEIAPRCGLETPDLTVCKKQRADTPVPSPPSSATVPPTPKGSSTSTSPRRSMASMVYVLLASGMLSIKFFF